MLVAQIFERLHRELLRGDRIAGLRHERCASLLQKRRHGRIETVEGFAEPQGCEIGLGTPRTSGGEAAPLDKALHSA